MPRPLNRNDRPRGERRTLRKVRTSVSVTRFAYGILLVGINLCAMYKATVDKDLIP